MDVPARTHSLVVNFGEVLSILSSGAVKATTHRVLSPPSSKLVGSARQTLAMFWQPPPYFKVKPLDDTSFGAHSSNLDTLPFGDWVQNALAVFRADTSCLVSSL